MVALTTAVALTPTVEAKPDNNNKGGHGGGKGGGGNARPAQIQQSRPQARPGGNFAGVQPYRGSQIQRYNRPQVQRTSPSVALTGRARPDALRERAAQQQQRVTTRGANWNERRGRIIDRLQRQQRWEDRKDRWEDHHDGDHHDWDDHNHYVPFSVHRYWDHNRVYYWNNYPYRWYNNAWVVVNPGYDYGYYDNDYGYGPDVREYSYSDGGSLTARVQEALADEGYDPGPIDGALGARTRDAIIDFQKDHSLAVTGRIDTPLLRELGL